MSHQIHNPLAHIQFVPQCNHLLRKRVQGWYMFGSSAKPRGHSCSCKYPTEIPKMTSRHSLNIQLLASFHVFVYHNDVQSLFDWPGQGLEMQVSFSLTVNGPSHSPPNWPKGLEQLFDRVLNPGSCSRHVMEQGPQADHCDQRPTTPNWTRIESTLRPTPAVHTCRYGFKSTKNNQRQFLTQLTTRCHK